MGDALEEKKLKIQIFQDKDGKSYIEKLKENIITP